MAPNPDVLTEVRGWNAYELATSAECADPDGLESPGARFLTLLRDAVIESLEYVAQDHDTWTEALRALSDNGTLNQHCDDAPDVYTHAMWEEFMDLAAYRENPWEHSAGVSDMEGAARVCLFIIAERLVQAVRSSIEESESDWEEEE